MNLAISFDPDIIAIFRQIVIDFPYHKERRLNTFAVLDQQTELNTSNLEKTYEQYRDGYFWAREWVNSGASRSKIQKDYDLLFLEHKKLVPDNLVDNNRASFEIFVTIASPVNCEGCNRSWEQVDRDNREMLAAVIKEFLSYGVYAVDESYAWISPGRAAVMEPSPSPTGQTMYQFLDNISEKVEIFTTNFGVDNLRTQSVKLDLAGCILPAINFNYSSSPTVKNTGIIACSLC